MRKKQQQEEEEATVTTCWGEVEARDEGVTASP
jgi:hypothetical protein